MNATGPYVTVGQFSLAGFLILIFSWFWIVHLPLVGMSVSDGIAVFEALGVSGIALVVAGVRRSGEIA